MCEWGNTTTRKLWVCAEDSHTGEGHWDVKEIDSCLAFQVDYLNAARRLTRSGWCGHGERDGSIVLHDGTTIRLPKRKI